MAIYKDKQKTKDGRQWYFKTYKNKKQIKSKKYLTKKEAQEAERLFLIKRDNPINKPFHLIAKDYLEYAYKINKESTAYSYESYYNNHIKYFFNNLNISEINIDILKRWQEYMINKKLDLKTLNKAYQVLSGIFNHAIKNFGLSTNYISILGPFKEVNEKVVYDIDKIRYITYDEFIKFISVIDDNMWKTFFIFLYYTGIRKGEIQALSWKDVNFEREEITVNKNLSIKIKDKSKTKYKITSTKNCRNRTIKMSKYLKEQLLNYKSIVKKYSDFNENWFIFGNTRFLPQSTIDRKKKKYFDLVNKNSKEKINEITIHEFRHSHVSLLINEYIKISKEKNMKVDMAKFFLMLSNRMGHTIKVMQETYMHLFPTIQDEIVDLLDNL